LPLSRAAARLTILSVLSIIYGLQGTITINNAHVTVFYSSSHNCVTPTVCKAASWLPAIAPTTSPPKLWRSAALAKAGATGGGLTVPLLPILRRANLVPAT
jgi:hypothetical protein